jgi:hypothetical protein
MKLPGNAKLSPKGRALMCRRVIEQGWSLGIKHIRTRPYRLQTNGKVCVLPSRCRPPGRRGSPVSDRRDDLGSVNIQAHHILT